MPDIPESGDTGASGTQQQEKISEVQVVKPLAGLPMVSTMQGLAAEHSKSMGGGLSASLIAGAFTQQAYDLQETKKELREIRDRLELTEQELSQCKVAKAILEEKVKALSRERNIKNLCITIGTALVTLAIDLLKNDLKMFASLVAVGGIVLLFTGWLSPKGGSK